MREERGEWEVREWTGWREGILEGSKLRNERRLDSRECYCRPMRESTDPF